MTPNSTVQLSANEPYDMGKWTLSLFSARLGRISRGSTAHVLIKRMLLKARLEQDNAIQRKGAGEGLCCLSLGLLEYKQTSVRAI